MLLAQNIKKLVIAMATFSLLSGCAALTSQTLDLHPELNVTRQLDKNTRIVVQPEDIRLNKTIGFRETGKTPPPQILLQDSKLLLQHTIEHALEDMGIRRFFAGEFTLGLKLVELNYKATKQGLKQVVDVDIRIDVDLSKANKRYTGSYKTNKQQTFLGTPSEEENEKIITELVTENMNLIVNDPKLLDFIQFN